MSRVDAMVEISCCTESMFFVSCMYSATEKPRHICSDWVDDSGVLAGRLERYWRRVIRHWRRSEGVDDARSLMDGRAGGERASEGVGVLLVVLAVDVE
jgi:hypothetical protein